MPRGPDSIQSRRWRSWPTSATAIRVTLGSHLSESRFPPQHQGHNNNVLLTGPCEAWKQEVGLFWKAGMYRLAQEPVGRS